MQTAELVDPGMEPAPGAEAPEIKKVPPAARKKEDWEGAEAKAALLLVLHGRLVGLVLTLDERCLLCSLLCLFFLPKRT
jgi:hypothetical protein